MPRRRFKPAAPSRYGERYHALVRHRKLSLFPLLLLAGPAAAQLPNNASVQGSYYFRYLGVNTVPANTALAFQGAIVFDGKTAADGYGSFTISGQGTSGAALGPASNNVYKVLSNGLIDLTNPLDATNATTLFGGVGATALALSSTDTNFCDLFLAVPVSTSNSAASLNGKYYLASLEFLNGNFALTRDTSFSANFDGKGALEPVTVNGTAIGFNHAPQSQTSTAATYTVAANGTGTLTFPAASGVAANNVLLSGMKTMYVAPDGSFFIAGGVSAYDFIVGVKALTGNPSAAANGLYFTASLENDIGANNASAVHGSDGSAIELGSRGIEIAHQRINPDSAPSFDYSSSFSYNLAADGTVVFPKSQYVVGAGGNIILGTGLSNHYLLDFHVKAPSLNGPGVFLNPRGVVNAASSVPFTASIAPGEFVTLSGTGLAAQSTPATTLPFPTTLGGVQVTISWIDGNGRTQAVLAPLSFVSSGAINALVPYNVPGDESLISFQVSNNSVASNSTRVYSGLSAPGIFTIPSGGIGNGAIQHSDFSLVSTASPAKVGETVLIYLTGLGVVTPSVPAGSAAPVSPFARTPTPNVFVEGIQAAVTFAGLTPGSAGLYQLNVTIPAGVTAGANVTIEIDTFDTNKNLLAVSSEATIPISK
jgi:uncharacterized protein (TIGR03437 family)